MNKQKIEIFIMLVLLAVSIYTYAKPVEINYDSRVKSSLDNLGLEYSITGTGNFKVLFETGEGRTQLVFISSDTEKLGEMEIREIFAIAAILEPDDLSQSSLFSLLELNDNYMLGAWQIHGERGDYLLLFSVKMSANTTQSALYDLIELAAIVADDMEQKLTNKDDF
jgi:hypothetical protein